MKKRFLPFNFFLSLIVLLVVLNGFTLFDGKKDRVVNSNKELAESSNGSSNYLKAVRNNQLTGLISSQDVYSAYEKAEFLKSQRSGGEIDWDVIGPENFGGRTRALLFDEKDNTGSTVYAGAVTGGIWRSRDFGLTWEKVNEDGQNLFVSCMAQADDGTIYVGTGEAFSSNNYSQLAHLGYSDGFMGTGIYKSSDGDSFELIETTKPQNGAPTADWAYINEIQIDGNGRIYAATNTGLKYSDDKGDTWNTAKDTDGNELSGVAMDVKAAGSFVVVTVDNNCYTSSGDASAFVNHSTGEINQLPVADEVGRVEFSIAPIDNKILYASFVDADGYLKGIYRSDNAGDSWEVILPETNSFQIFLGFGKYNSVIEVYPDDADKVLVGGLDLWVGFKTGDGGLFYWEQKSSFLTSPYSPLYVARGHNCYAFRPGHPKQFMIGTNSGLFTGEYSGADFTFAPVNRKYYTTQFYRIANSGVEDYTISGAQENGVLMITNEYNSKEYATQLFSNGSYGCDAAISLINPDVIVYSSIYGTVFRSEDRGVTTSNQFLTDPIKNGTGFITPVALWESFNNENSRDSIWYHAREDIASGTTITIRSANSGYPFKYTLNSELQKGDSIQVVDPVSSRFFIAVSGKVFMTKELHNFGKTPEWFLIADASVGFEGMPNALSYSADGNHLWVGTIEGKVYRISNLALAYNKELADITQPTCIVANSVVEITNPETGNPVDQAVTSISVDPQNPSKVLVTYGNYGNANYVYYTENGLDQNPEFKSKQGNLPEMPVYASVIEMSDSKRVIIGTESGVYSTDDITNNNPSWTFDSKQFGSVPVFDLRQQTVAQKSVTIELINGTDTSNIVYPGATNYGIIYAATFGRGLFKTSTYRKPVGIDEIYSEGNIGSKGTLKVYPNPVTNVVYFDVDVKESNSVEAFVYNQTGKLFTAKHVKLSKGVNRVGIDVSNLATGSYIIKVKIGTKIKTQKFVKL